MNWFTDQSLYCMIRVVFGTTLNSDFKACSTWRIEISQIDSLPDSRVEQIPISRALCTFFAYCNLLRRKPQWRRQHKCRLKEELPWIASDVRLQPPAMAKIISHFDPQLIWNSQLSTIDPLLRYKYNRCRKRGEFSFLGNDENSTLSTRTWN